MPLIPNRQSLKPLDPPMTPLAVIGTILWLIAATILWINIDTLNETNRSWWLDCALYGAALGIPGTIVMVLHDSKRKRARATNSPDITRTSD